MGLRRAKEVLTILETMKDLEDFTENSLCESMSKLTINEIEDLSKLLLRMSYIIDDIKIKIDMNPYNAISSIKTKAMLIQFKREDMNG